MSECKHSRPACDDCLELRSDTMTNTDQTGQPESASGVQDGSKLEGQQPEDDELKVDFNNGEFAWFDRILLKMAIQEKTTNTDDEKEQVWMESRAAIIAGFTAWADRRADRRSQAVGVDELVDELIAVLSAIHLDLQCKHITDQEAFQRHQNLERKMKLKLQAKITEAYEKGKADHA